MSEPQINREVSPAEVPPGMVPLDALLPDGLTVGEALRRPLDLPQEAAFREVWGDLSRIDCTQHIEQKNGLSYLSWAWAYGILQERFPGATYRFHADQAYPGNTFMVSCTVSITHRGTLLERSMWLPVMDHKNKAIANPDARAFNDARMRCLTKCISMFGLGHYIYAGEDLPMEAVEPPPAVQAAAARQQPARPAKQTPAAVANVAAQAVDQSANAQPGTVAESALPTEITTAEGAQYAVDMLLALADGMHGNSMQALVDFWKRNAKTIDLLDGAWPEHYEKLKVGFSAIKAKITPPPSTAGAQE